MKHFFKIGFVLFIATLMLSSCKKDDPSDNMLNVVVTVNMPDEFINSRYSGNVTIINKDMGKEYTDIAADGIVEFKVYPGIYNLEAQFTMTAEDAKKAAPTLSFSTDIIITGIVKEFKVEQSVDDMPTRVEVNTDWAVKSDLLISKVYCDGTKNNNGKNNNIPKYWEIFNNTREDIYLDGLCLAQAHGNTTSKNPCKLYVNDKDHTYASRIARFPGNHGIDRNIPLAPGKSIVIAWQASNFIIPENTSETATDQCTMNVDLSQSDYEIESTNWAWKNLGDNILIPNLTVPYDCLPSAGFLQLQNAMFIFFATEDDIEKWETDIDDSSYAIGSQKKWQAKRVPNDIIIDAMEVFKQGANQQKRIPDVLNAAGIEGPQNEGVIYDRKIQRIELDGRIVLKDTNNAKEDFVVVVSRNREAYDGSHLVIRDYTKPEIQPK